MRPLMVIAGEFWDGATALGLADGFRRAGFDVVTFDSRYYSITSDGDLFLRGASRLVNRRAMQMYKARLFADCAVDRPAVFLTVKGLHIDREILESFKARGAKLAIFYPDVNFRHAGVAPDLFNLYDFVFTTKLFHLPWMRENLRGPQVHHIDHGYSAMHVALPGDESEEAYAFDVTYIGTCSPYKFKWLAELKTLRPDLKLKVFGWFWKAPAAGTILESSVYGRGIEGVLFRRLITRSRINLAVHYGPDRQGWADSISTRTFQIPAARGFMLHIDNEEVRSHYDVGSEIDVFTTPQEMAEKIDFYLAHPERRAAMIDAAYARAIPAYSYDARAAEMSRLMGFGARADAVSGLQTDARGPRSREDALTRGRHAGP